MTPGIDSTESIPCKNQFLCENDSWKHRFHVKKLEISELSSSYSMLCVVEGHLNCFKNLQHIFYMLRFNNNLLFGSHKSVIDTPFLHQNFFLYKWIIKVTEILYKILTLNNPKCLCKFYVNQSNQTMFESMLYYEVDPGPGEKFI